MIVVKLKCGLGNQMFQFALGRRLSLDWQDDLKFDLSWFNNLKKGDIPRDLAIDKFNVNLIEATEKEIALIKPGIIDRVKEKILGRLNRNHFYRFYPSILKKKSKIYLDGYYQNFNYFDSIRNVLLSDFTVENGYSSVALTVQNEIKTCDQSVAIHIRRGDYATVRQDYNGLCDLAYYEEGIKVITNKYPAIKLFVFSDDIVWAKENLHYNFPTTFVSQPAINDVEELLLMSECKHQVIANSTFSWWAAWLNNNANKIVIAPSRWLLAADIDTQDLLPESWIKI